MPIWTQIGDAFELIDQRLGNSGIHQRVSPDEDVMRIKETPGGECIEYRRVSPTSYSTTNLGHSAPFTLPA